MLAPFRRNEARATAVRDEPGNARAGKQITISARMAPSTKRQYCVSDCSWSCSKLKRQRADDRAEEAREPAEHRHEHELAGVRPVHQLGVGQPVAEAEDGAADRAE